MGDVMGEIARCDAEIAHCWNHECQPGDWLGAVMGWADWMIERQLILERGV